MKKHFLFILLATNSFFAQTQLQALDIAILLNQTDAPDDFAFVTFVDIAPNTVIYFTDCGADSSGFANPCVEGALKYTVPSSGLTMGQIIKYSDNLSNFVAYNDSRITGSFATSTAGDQIIAFQDSNSAIGSSNAANNPLFLFASSTASTVFSGDKNNNNETGLPLGLTETGLPRSAMGLGVSNLPSDEFDNAVYIGPYSFSTIAEAKSTITNPINYFQNNNITETAYMDAFNNIPLTITIGSLSSQQFDKYNFRVYPNPAKNSINFENTSEVIIDKIEIFDVNGKLVESYNNYNKSYLLNKIEISDLNSGFYFLKIYVENKIIDKKIQIIN
ncbi:T9SS type A sorting domain-containing protein [Flavobacterium piscinae]|uniref:T9SS type A sorting domain-containing protein n=1 Tax=Flavobacterium piscinae TaxID=2506424 RepID=A0A4Q1KX01_9FLAO|nr:T9SS type A sorting domain-containing protein [Flavobacterium piscinae]RXR34772.1 T9SS type A sorting domain-containing protein [Flavobacterium piscinae]